MSSTSSSSSCRHTRNRTASTEPRNVRILCGQQCFKKTVPFCFLYPVNVMYVSWFLNYSNATVVMSVGRSNVPTTNCPSLLFSINLSFVFRRSLSSSSSKRHSTFGDLNSSKKSIDGEPDSKNEKKHKHHKHSAKKKTKSKHKSKKR